MREIIVPEPTKYRFKYVGLRRRPVLQVATKRRVPINPWGDTTIITEWNDATPEQAERLLFEREKK